MYAELSRLRLALMLIIPVGTTLLALLLTWFVRMQLKPLEAVARSSASIGPANTSARIDVEANALEIVQLREAINGMISRMAEGLERERRFSSFAAHELRTPLAQLRANIEVTLRRERDGVEYKRSLNEALLDIERLQKLVTDLLNLTRAQEAVVAPTERAALDVVISQAARASGQAVHFESQSSPEIRGNEELLISAVRNVLENAARYAPASSPTLAVESDSKQVRLKIADLGPGIPEAERERIFQPLTRLDSARSITDQSGGFGLGLAIARSATRACGGDLLCGARSDGKSGAQFMFIFQRASIVN
jgi:signal transduction histidine kinase